MSLRISEIKKHAKQSLKGNWGLVVLLTLILFLINAVIPMLIEIKLSGDFTSFINNEPLGANLVGWIFSIALIPLSVSVYWFYLALVRKENPQISKVFTWLKESKDYFKLMGLSLLQSLFIFLWSLLLVVPGIIKSLAYSQAFFLLRDHPEYTVIQAIKESKNRMKGYKWKYFLLFLSFIGWGILCLFTLGIGLLWLVPYISTSVAIFYNEFIYPQCRESQSKAEYHN